MARDFCNLDLLARLTVARRDVERFILDHVDKQARGLGVEALLLLVRLYRNGPMSASDFVKYFGAKTSPAYIVNVLFGHGYVGREQDPDNSRRVAIVLTEKGRAVGEMALPVVEFVDEHLGRDVFPDIATLRGRITDFYNTVPRPEISGKKEPASAT